MSNALAQDDSDLLFTLELVLVSIVVEIVNAWVINHVFFRKKNLGVHRVVLDCFQDNRFAFITTIISAALIINPIYDFTTDNSF